MFYNHHNCDDNVTIIPSAMGIRQNDYLRRALFVLAHSKALCFTTSHFFFCLFLSITDDIHIIFLPLFYCLHMNTFKLNFV
jgi:hypothetical protein